MIACSKVNFSNAKQCASLMHLLNIYASDFMGGGEPLSPFTKANLIQALRDRPFAHAFLAHIDEVPVGLTIGFEGFSTFDCKPLINLHDMVVHPEHRRKGVASTLFMAVEQFGREQGYCKITLEVLQGNHPAKATYKSVGFQAYDLGPDNGIAEFWQKKIV